jgi:hypothetical protein
MQKATSVLLGAGVVLATALVIWRAGPRTRAAGAAPSADSIDASAGRVPALPAGDPSMDLAVLEGSPTSILGKRGPGSFLLDGSVPPELPNSAPKSLRFGVVLIQYREAQRAVATSRSKPEALALANELARVAQTDFKAAVDRGDAGSTENAGRISVGILEPAPNYVLFSLAQGGVGGPVDTPTGYWVVRNLGK